MPIVLFANMGEVKKHNLETKMRVQVGVFGLICVAVVV